MAMKETLEAIFVLVQDYLADYCDDSWIDYGSLDDPEYLSEVRSTKAKEMETVKKFEDAIQFIKDKTGLWT